MENQNQSQTFCKRIAYNSGTESANIILGKIIHEDSFFLKVETAKGEHVIQKSQIISITDTTIPFKKVMSYE